MAGEYTAKINDYVNIMKNNGLVTIDGELITPNIKCLENIAMDFVNMEEQKKEKTQEILQWQKEKTEFQEAILDGCGHFYFNFYNRLLDKLKPQHLTRFLYLSCYINYDNLLVINKTTRHIPIYEEDLQSILKLSRTEVYSTKIELIEKELLIINDDKTLSINPKYCKKGDIMKNKKIGKTRMFENGIKELYEKSKPTEHKQLALLFQLLPYLNFGYNVICKNEDVTQEVLEHIHPYTLNEIADILGQTNITRFKKRLMDMTVNGESVVCINEIKNKKLITINPKVFYKGTRLEDLKYLQGLFNMRLNRLI